MLPSVYYELGSTAPISQMCKQRPQNMLLLSPALLWPSWSLSLGWARCLVTPAAAFCILGFSWHPWDLCSSAGGLMESRFVDQIITQKGLWLKTFLLQFGRFPQLPLVVIEAQEGLDFRAKFFLLLISKVTVFLASEKQL